MMNEHIPVTSGLIIADKPEGMSSFSVVSMVRRLTGVKKVGHSGTLDPFATGVLPICIGRSTRLIRYLGNDSKEYRCTVRFGSFSETQDSEGTLYGGRRPDKRELESMRGDDFASLRKLFDALPGIVEQTPPAYSAVKVNGRKAYEYARKGIPVELKPRKVRIFDCKILNISSEAELEVEFLISCSKGTYIRAICEDLGKKSGFGAYAIQLRRTRCGAFGLDDAHSPEEIKQAFLTGHFNDLFTPEEICVRHLPAIALTEEEVEHLRNGRLLPLSEFSGRMAGSKISNDENTELEASEEGHDVPRFRAIFENRLIAIVYPSEVDDNNVLRIERMLDEL